MRSAARLDLLQSFPLLKTMLRSRAFQPAVTLITLFVFTLAILTGLLGTSAGNRNFGLVFVWVVWWGLLILVLVPFTGRLWCAVCPIPAPGEWLQRRSIINRASGRLHTLGWRWPRYLRNRWLLNAGFLGVALFSVVILTRPNVTAWLLLTFMIVSTLLSVLFENRVFCRYVCPVSGFIGLYAQVAPTELRVRDPQVCAAHTTKDCITGNERGYGCPWLIYPGALTHNTDCGMCMECLKTCPQDNIVINVRPFASDVWTGTERHLDEAVSAFTMLGCALIYTLVLLGPDGWLKESANLITLPDWLFYVIFFLTVNLAALPGLFWLVTALTKVLARQQAPIRRLFVDYAFVLIPIGLAAWVAFSLGVVLVNGSEALNVLSDPFGWGWNLFGTANTPWLPLKSGLIHVLQTGALTLGLLLGVRVAYRIARQHSRSHRQAFVATLPLAGWMLLVTLTFLALFMG